MNIALRCWRKTDPVDATRNVNLQVNHLVIISLRQRLNSFISVSCHETQMYHFISVSCHELGIKWYICVAASIRSHGLSHRISVGHFNNMTRLWGAVHAKLCLFFTRLIWETRNIPMKHSSLSCISFFVSRIKHHVQGGYSPVPHRYVLPQRI